tara:strand:- start:1653 stop:2000 length:348 start_codon:yes stop_codon:yes gene_type:complete
MAKNVVPKKLENLPAEFEEEFLADVEEFEEHLTQDDMAVPFLQILQALSPQVTEGEDQFLEQADKGMILTLLVNNSMMEKRVFALFQCGISILLLSGYHVHLEEDLLQSMTKAAN